MNALTPGEEESCLSHKEGRTNASDACAAFRRASRALTQLYDLVLAPTEMRATQYIVLQTIAANTEIAQWRLAKEIEVAPETLSRQLANLRSSGLVKVRTGAGRKGERLYQLTPTGLRKLKAAAPYWHRAQERLRTVIGPTVLDSVLLAADQVAGAARRAESARIANTVPESD